MSLKMILFVITLSPWLWYHFCLWLTHPNIVRNQEYGKGAKYRHLLDIYLPPIRSKENKLYPVAIILGGGAWIIGYKFWSTLIARRLSLRNILVVVPDYRNFPQGNIIDMKNDLKLVLAWTVEFVHLYHGDSTNIILIGHSAGAHILMCSMLDLYLETETDPVYKLLSDCSSAIQSPVVQANSMNGAKVECSVWRNVQSAPNSPDEKQNHDNVTLVTTTLAAVEDEYTSSTLTPCSACDENYQLTDFLSRVRLFIGISGAYDLEGLSAHLHSRGLDASILAWICDGDIKHYSPTTQIPLLAAQIEQCSFGYLATNGEGRGISEVYRAFSRFPPVLLLHGSSDSSIPPSASVDLAKALLSAGGSATVQLYDGWSHTYAVLEGPLSGDHRLVEDMISGITKALGERHCFVGRNESSNPYFEWKLTHPPTALLHLAKHLNPF